MLRIRLEIKLDPQCVQTRHGIEKDRKQIHEHCIGLQSFTYSKRYYYPFGMHEEISVFSVAPGAHRTSTRRAETIYVGSWRKLARATAEKIDKAHYIAQGTGGYERRFRQWRVVKTTKTYY
jgi:hypothetical protein